MSRQLRIEYPGALYHVTSRGNNRDDIFRDDEDREKFIEMWRQELEQQGWICYAYCLMDNHYHLLFETPEGNLSKGMQRFNGRYTQYFNHCHQRVGHLFQGRYKAILVEKDSYLLELCRYVVLNPVRAKMVECVGDWSWSSYLATSGDVQSESWLAVDTVRSLFGASVHSSIVNYKQFVTDGLNHESPWDLLRGQIYLGDDDFLESLELKIDAQHRDRDIVVDQRFPLRSDASEVLKEVMQLYQLDHASVVNKLNKEPFRLLVFLLRQACNLSLKEVSAVVGVSEGRVSQIHHAVMKGEYTENMRLLAKKFKV